MIGAFEPIRTERLLLDAFREGDVDALVRLAGAREIADTTAAIPHPYSAEDARRFLADDAAERADGRAIRFAVRHPGGELVGCIGLHRIDRESAKAELGYWIGVPWWRRGYATEAARAVLRYAFDALGLNKVYAHHLVRNMASGRVLERIGMRPEGLLRQEIRKAGRFEDVLLWGVLRSDTIRPAASPADSAPAPAAAG